MGRRAATLLGFTLLLNKNRITILKGCYLKDRERERERDSSPGEDILSGPPYKLIILTPTSSVRKLRPGKVKTVLRGHMAVPEDRGDIQSWQWALSGDGGGPSSLATRLQVKCLSMGGFSFVMCSRKSVKPFCQVLGGLKKLM